MDTKSELNNHISHLYAAAVSKTHDSLAAEDIAQETLLAALNSLSRGFVPDNMWAWLYRIMLNKYSDWLREKYNKPTVSFDLIPYEDIPEDSDEFEENERRIELIKRELGYLASSHREVMLRFYMRGESIEHIARELGIPVGTVKSRLHTGRDRIRKEVEDMENYTKQCYEPDRLDISCSGSCGLNNEPFSLAKEDDLLTQNLLILAYEKPVSETELAKQLGVPTVFIEPIINRLVDGELMKRTDSDKVYSDFIIYSEKARNGSLDEQVKLVDTHFDLFWKPIEAALSDLRECEYYKRQCSGTDGMDSVKMKLELHFVIKLLMNGCAGVREKCIDEVMPYSEYPHRKDGGRWFAMGMRRSTTDKPEAWWRYSISGEAGEEIRGYLGAASIELRKYETGLGKYPNQYDRSEYIKWLYELYIGTPAEQSQVVWNTIDAAELMIERGVLRREETLKLNIPVLTRKEYRDEVLLASRHSELLANEISDVYSRLFETGGVKLPPHLTGVPKWQQYMFCGGHVQMAVIWKAVESGKLFAGKDELFGKLPAALLIVDAE